MGQFIINIDLCDFLWHLLTVGTGQDRNHIKPAFMLHFLDTEGFFLLRWSFYTQILASSMFKPLYYLPNP